MAYTLVFCDRYKDGGSIGLTIEQQGAFLSFWLQVSPLAQAGNEQPEYLYLSEGEVPAAKEEKIAIASVSEQYWLEQFLRTNTNLCTEQSVDIFMSLIGVLQHRNI